MTQKVDVKIIRADDSVVILTNQDSGNVALRTRVLNAMHTAKHIDIDRHTQTPTPPHPPQHPAGTRCVYFSTVTDFGIQNLRELGHGYTALFSADLNLSVPGKPYYVNDNQIGQLQDAGVVVASWCDCSATPYTAAQQMASERGLAYAGGQAEDADQYQQAIALGARQIIGNPANLGQSLRDAVARSNAGTLAFIGEVMAPDPSYSAQGVNITSACFYVDRDAAQGGYIPLAAYENMPKSLRDGCSIYTGGRMTGDDWATYAAWTHP